MSFGLKAVGIPHSSYYYAIKPKSKIHDDAALIQAVDEIRLTDPKYTKKHGYRKITDKLHDQGFIVNHKCVLRIMTEHNWLSNYFVRGKQSSLHHRSTISKVGHRLVNFGMAQ